MDQLPNEILETIFYNLSLEDRKRASEVCRRWSSVVLSRNRLNDVLLKVFYQDRSKDDYAQVLSLSERAYKRVAIKLSDATKDVVLEVLHKCGNSLEWLLVEGIDDDSAKQISSDEFVTTFCRCVLSMSSLKELRLVGLNIKFRRFEDIILPEMSHLSQLETLYLDDGSMEFGCFDWNQIAPNVKCLYFPHNENAIKFYEMLSFYSNRLEKIGLTTDHPDKYFNELAEEVTFPKVHSLSLLCYRLPRFGHATQFFQRFNNLTSLTVGFAISSETLNLIVSKFPSLEHVQLYETLPEDVFISLSRLPKLRHLTLKAIGYDYWQMSPNHVLPSLQQLTIHLMEWENVGNFYRVLSQIAPKLECYEFIAGDGEAHMPHICQHLVNIKRLAFDGWDGDLEHSNFIKLYRLSKLTDLRLNSYWDTFYWSKIPRTTSVRRLFISWDQRVHIPDPAREEREWRQMIKCLPSLELLQIATGLTETAEQQRKLEELLAPSGCRVEFNGVNIRRGQIFQPGVTDCNRQAETWLMRP
ncbi:uncharacterized protein LOC129737780 [Uranotaenia lowii]|uniref:uncharacterized protein LOC129737780 n=1 Tax=Uranotaenia lowii TaxID=190385 RepID=UPI00247997BC|nr:uncharacterized protein LOC129737780 [Uranotaenia lowii]